jgi:hypothetical protein
MNADRLSQLRKKVINKKGQSGNMVQMSVRQNYVPDLSPLQIASGECEAASVDSDPVVNDE